MRRSLALIRETWTFAWEREPGEEGQTDAPSAPAPLTFSMLRPEGNPSPDPVASDEGEADRASVETETIPPGS